MMNFQTTRYNTALDEITGVRVEGGKVDAVETDEKNSITTEVKPM